MSAWNYQHLLHHLGQLNEGHIQPGLERMHAACERLAYPERVLRAIHIAGTNGKGSTGAFLRALLMATGARVGHYTSPHLIDFTERFTINAEPVAPDTLAAHGERIATTCGDIPLSYFEFVTGLGFLVFAGASLDYAIIEVGLGGRWDATNVIVPEVSVLTPIGTDHMAYLGNTIAAITREKCGIIKPGVPVVSAPQPDPIALWVIQETCAARGAPLTIAEPTGPETPLALVGAHQRVNAGVALAAANVLWGQVPAQVRSYLSPALGNAAWPGRCEWVSRDPPILFDGAHNPQAAAALAAYLTEVRAGREIICCLGVMRDKDVDGILAALHPVVNRFVAVQAPTVRGLSAEALAARIRRKGSLVDRYDALDDGLTYAQTYARTHASLVVITGSLYLYAPARMVLASHLRKS